jgi:hypothetical protein
MLGLVLFGIDIWVEIHIYNSDYVDLDINSGLFSDGS